MNFATCVSSDYILTTMTKTQKLFCTMLVSWLLCVGANTGMALTPMQPQKQPTAENPRIEAERQARLAERNAAKAEKYAREAEMKEAAAAREK